MTTKTLDTYNIPEASQAMFKEALITFPGPVSRLDYLYFKIKDSDKEIIPSKDKKTQEYIGYCKEKGIIPFSIMEMRKDTSEIKIQTDKEKLETSTFELLLGRKIERISIFGKEAYTKLQSLGVFGSLFNQGYELDRACLWLPGSSLENAVPNYLQLNNTWNPKGLELKLSDRKTLGNSNVEAILRWYEALEINYDRQKHLKFKN